MSRAKKLGGAGEFELDWVFESFAIYQRDWIIWSAVTLIAVLTTFVCLYSLPLMLSGFNWIDEDTLLLLDILIGFIFASCFAGGFSVMANKAVRGETLQLRNVGSGLILLPSFFVYSALFLVSLVVGACICFVGALISLILLWPGYAALADGRGINYALRQSYDISSPVGVRDLLLSIFLLLIVIVSALPLGLGLLVTLPVTFIVASLAYNNLLAAGSDGSGVAASEDFWPPAPIDPEGHDRP